MAKQIFTNEKDMNAGTMLLIVLQVITWISVACQGSEECGCKDGWVPFSAHCYLLNETLVDLPTARTWCQVMGAHLVSVHSQKENEFVINTMTTRRDAWIGLVYNDTMAGCSARAACNRGDMSMWQWADDSLMTYTNWRRNEPTGDSPCARIRHGDRKWADKWCTAKYPFICKRPCVFRVDGVTPGEVTTHQVTTTDRPGPSTAVVNAATHSEMTAVSPILAADRPISQPVAIAVSVSAVLVVLLAGACIGLVKLCRSRRVAQPEADENPYRNQLAVWLHGADGLGQPHTITGKPKSHGPLLPPPNSILACSEFDFIHFGSPCTERASNHSPRDSMSIENFTWDADQC